jgi:hypothetical protein
MPGQKLSSWPNVTNTAFQQQIYPEGGVSQHAFFLL